MKTSEVLHYAMKLVKKGHTKGFFATTKKGVQVPYASEKAACFCAGGALHRARADLEIGVGESLEAFSALRRAIPEDVEDRSISSYNDQSEMTQDDVVAWFMRAIEVEKAKES